jgi:hypothetical protein
VADVAVGARDPLRGGDHGVGVEVVDDAGQQPVVLVHLVEPLVLDLDPWPTNAEGAMPP